MSAPHQCRIEFYFKADQIQKLLTDNPDAKGIIISEEIRREKPHGMDHYINVVHLTARVDLHEGAKKSSVNGGGDEIVDGCPYPPGCNA